MNALPVSRRQVLLAGIGSFVLLSCGSGEEEEDGVATDNGDDGSTTTSSPEVAGGVALYKVFAPEQPVGVELRLPLALAGADGSLDVEAPEKVTVRVRPPEGGTGSGPVEIARRSEGIPRGYYPLHTTFDLPGRWGIVVEAGKVQVETSVDARPASELPSVPGPGDLLPKLATPTTADPRGVDPLCTREPACPFHDRPLADAVGGADPIILLVSTPAFCQTAICGPVLDLLVDRQGDLLAAGTAIIHAEVYVDERAKETTDTVNALGLTYEPALFLAAPDGTVTTRLDYTFDATELDEALAELLP